MKEPSSKDYRFALRGGDYAPDLAMDDLSAYFVRGGYSFAFNGDFCLDQKGWSYRLTPVHGAGNGLRHALDYMGSKLKGKVYRDLWIVYADERKERVASILEFEWKVKYELQKELKVGS